MECDRALEILNSIKSATNIVCSYEEISELVGFNLISEFTLQEPSRSLEHDLKGQKNQFIRLNSEIRDSYKNLMSMEADYEKMSLFSGKNKLKKEIKTLKNILENKEVEVKNLKDGILSITLEKEAYERAVRVNGKKVVLTPLGEKMIDEIQARRRFYSRELSDLINVIRRLDEEFGRIINQIGNIMRTNRFSPIWALYLINTNMQNLTHIMDAITMSEYSYNNAQKKMMRLSFYLMNHPEIPVPRNVRAVKTLDAEFKYQYGKYAPIQQLNEMFNSAGISTFNIQKALSLLSRLFSIWVSKDRQNVQDLDEYLNNLKIFVDFKGDLPMIGKKTRLYEHLNQRIDEEMQYVFLTLAYSTNLDAYNYFYSLFQEVPEGNKFFSSIATLFPWDPEETWMILLRAQSNILKAQSAKFIPELIEYALLMALNPNILTIENNMTQEQLIKWRLLIIPTIHLSIYSFLEKDLETYIRRRPLAYIIAPRYYHYSMLHYHAIG
ncbi:MAG: hypothetical protein ACFFKA_17415 [Candidatus Thorarchaeota archaeon]